MAVLLSMLIVPIAEVLGVGPLSRWAWSSFETAETAWHRLAIVAAIMAALAAAGYGTYRGGKHLAGIYHG